MRGEPVSPRIDRDVRDAERAVLPDDQAQEPVTTGQCADARPGLPADARRDEPLDDTVRMHDPESGVRCADQWPDLIDDHLEGVVDRLETRDRPGRRIQGIDRAGRRLRILLAAHGRHGTSEQLRSPRPMAADRGRRGWSRTGRAVRQGVMVTG
jgi:hypothetical protein